MAAPVRSSVLPRALTAGVAALALLSSQSPAIAKVGVAAAVNTDARGRTPGGAPRVISLGQTVIFKEEIVTDGRGLVQVLLLDGTTFTVGPNSQLTIDEFVYNPATGDAKVVATVAKGAFRFIGGQTSRRADSATINTPVGTIGIRGAMVEGRVDSSDQALFSMIFGDEVQFRGRDGKRSRIYEPGYTLVVRGTNGGGVDTNVRRRTEGDASTFQTALAGGDGQSGGASEKPDDGTVAKSPVPQSNSNLPNTVPIPTPRSIAVKSSGIEEVETKVSDVDTRGTVLPPQTPGMVYFGGPGAISGFSIMSFDAPPPPFLTSEQKTFFKTGGRLFADDGTIDLPDHTGTQGDTELDPIPVTDGRYGDNTLTGYAYAGRGDFVAYLLHYGIGSEYYEDETTYPFYMIHGTGTELTSAPENGSLNDIRQYSLTSDPDIGVPFLAPETYGPVTSFSATDFYIVEPAGSESGEFKTFMSWISIEDSMVVIDEVEVRSQKSAIFVTASASSTEIQIDENENEREVDILTGARRGSYRVGPSYSASSMGGTMTTLAGPDGSHFFGDNADHFVIGSSLDPDNAFVDSTASSHGGGDPFITHHVAALVGETQQAEPAPLPFIYTGFMAGMGESSSSSSPYPYALAAGGGPNFYLELNEAENTVSAVGIVTDTLYGNNGVDSYLLTFGAAPTADLGLGLFGPLITGGVENTGGSAYVAWDIYGAVQNDDPRNTRILTDGYGEYAGEYGIEYESEPRQINHTSSTSPGSYLVSGRANPIAGYEHCLDCDFLDWGWWGTRVSVDDEEGIGSRTDVVHMGTWVAGDITSEADMPTGITATYTGRALGTVSRDGANYIASGTMGMTFDFNDRAGNLSINNFDGITVSAQVSDINTPNQGTFTGNWGTSGFSGGVSGAFVNNGTIKAGGVIGDFVIGGTGVLATGTIAGSTTDLP